ncbi:MAG: hypothetical protein WKF59_01175 [Chitinophagaceae bacterium]
MIKGMLLMKKKLQEAEKGGNSYITMMIKIDLQMWCIIMKEPKRLLPDYMYEYTQLSQIKQMISTDDNTNNYFCLEIHIQ